MVDRMFGRMFPKSFHNPSGTLPEAPPLDESDDATVRAFVEAVEIASEMWTAQEMAIWLTSPQPLLANWTPVQMLGCGRAVPLRDVLRNISDGVYL